MMILLMGPQGCGKGTQGEKLSGFLNIPLITVGDLLRDLSQTHPRYVELHSVMDKGELAPFDLVAQLIQEKITALNCGSNYILDGWARSLHNLNFFDPNPDLVLVINISRQESVRRVSGRRTCETDGKVYNIYTLPKEEVAKCAGNLVQREDDTEDAVNRRLDIYQTETLPVIEYFKKRGTKVIEIDGEQTPEDVFKSVTAYL